MRCAQGTPWHPAQAKALEIITVHGGCLYLCFEAWGLQGQASFDESMDPLNLALNMWNINDINMEAVTICGKWIFWNSRFFNCPSGKDYIAMENHNV